MGILLFVFYFESMDSLSYISALSLVSIGVSFAYIFSTDVFLMYEPRVDKTIEMIDYSGLVYFFGTSIFIFEGNPLIIEIYHQADT